MTLLELATASQRGKEAPYNIYRDMNKNMKLICTALVNAGPLGLSEGQLKKRVRNLVLDEIDPKIIKKAPLWMWGHAFIESRENKKRFEEMDPREVILNRAQESDDYKFFHQYREAKRVFDNKTDPKNLKLRYQVVRQDIYVLIAMSQF